LSKRNGVKYRLEAIREPALNLGNIRVIVYYFVLKLPRFLHYENVPDKPGIYFIVRKNSQQIEYVGQSINCQKRVYQHTTTKTELEFGGHKRYFYSFYECEDEHERILAEAFFISALVPKMNKLIQCWVHPKPENEEE